MIRLRKIFIKNWVVDAGIGIYAHELNKKQKIRLTITFFQEETIPFRSKKIADIVDYDAHSKAIQRVIDSGHEGLIESLADRIAESCLKDPKVQKVIVELEKLAILPGTESCGVMLERVRGDY